MQVSLRSFVAFYYVLISSSPGDSLALSCRINGLCHARLCGHLSVALRLGKHPSPFSTSCHSPPLSVSLPIHLLTLLPISALLRQWCSVASQSARNQIQLSNKDTCTKKIKEERCPLAASPSLRVLKCRGSKGGGCLFLPGYILLYFEPEFLFVMLLLIGSPEDLIVWAGKMDDQGSVAALQRRREPKRELY